MARQYKRFSPKNSRYQRKTKDKHGKEIVQYIERKDFDEMVRRCLIKRNASVNHPKTYFRWYRNYVFLILGVNTGIRTETACELIGRDIYGGKFVVTEHKTGKRQQFEMDKEVYQIIKDYMTEFGFDKDLNKFIFPNNMGSLDAITRQATRNWIHKLSKDVGIEYPVGAYSLRKSYARWLYDEDHDLLKVQYLLGHNSPEVTMRYIGLEPNQIEEERQKIRHLPEYR